MENAGTLGGNVLTVKRPQSEEEEGPLRWRKGTRGAGAQTLTHQVFRDRAEIQVHRKRCLPETEMWAFVKPVAKMEFGPRGNTDLSSVHSSCFTWFPPQN